ncbi:MULTISPECIES: hypothetical protein [unclassified Anaeromyxobacter]|uniref:hypothetical protein n=1 Tax=unclassified Anaeromyxobacter TaxID=2620896 RepID=UPI001F58616C|nr:MULTISPECIES: hypothetical protein [unclassified Anaeromyxobacter]
MNEPSQFHPAFTAERLKALASVIVRVRRAALDLHDAESGERNLSLGTRTFERGCEAFRRLAGEVEWLKYYESGNYFLLLVEGVPVKFHRTDPDDPNPRTTRELQPEMVLKQKAFVFMETLEPQRAPGDMLGSALRLYFQDDPLTKEVFRVAFARVGPDGKTLQSWDIDLTDVVTPLAPLGGDLPEAPDLDQPNVGPKPPAARKTETEDE